MALLGQVSAMSTARFIDRNAAADDRPITVTGVDSNGLHVAGNAYVNGGGYVDEAFEDLKKEVEALKSAQEAKKPEDQDVEWVPTVGDRFLYVYDLGDGNRKYCLGVPETINGFEDFDQERHGSAWGMDVRWLADPDNFYPPTHLCLPDPTILVPTHEQVLDLTVREMAKEKIEGGDLHRNHTLKVGDSVRHQSYMDSFGVITEIADYNHDHITIDWKGNVFPPSQEYYYNLEILSAAELAEVQRKTLDDQNNRMVNMEFELHQYKTEAEEKQREAAEREEKLQQELEDQKARSMDLEDRFAYFLGRVEELERRGAEAEAEAREIERQELLPVVQSMSKRQKVKFFIKQMAKNVGKEVLIRMAQNYGLSTEWLMRFITG